MGKGGFGEGVCTSTPECLCKCTVCGAVLPRIQARRLPCLQSKYWWLCFLPLSGPTRLAGETQAAHCLGLRCRGSRKQEDRHTRQPFSLLRPYVVFNFNGCALTCHIIQSNQNDDLCTVRNTSVVCKVSFATSAVPGLCSQSLRCADGWKMLTFINWAVDKC